MEALWQTHSTLIISVAVGAALAVAAVVWSFMRSAKQNEIEHLKNRRKSARVPSQQTPVSPKRPSSSVQAQAKTLLQSMAYASQQVVSIKFGSVLILHIQ